MESSKYNEDKEKISRKYSYWLYFFRQLFSCSPVIWNYFISGLFMGSFTVTIPQFKKENPDEVITIEKMSLLPSISSFTAVPWAIILPLIAYRFGRKVPLILCNLNILLANILFYRSTNVMDLIISQASLGLFVSSMLSITAMVTSEYTSPKYRGVLMSSKGATFYWGVWVSNAIGTFSHWKNISILIFVCNFFSLVSCVFCRESPYWLATKGKFEECAKVHRWLKGIGENSEKELCKLIISQKEKNDMKVQKRQRDKLKCDKIHKILKVMRYQGFYKPLVYAILPILMYNFSGKVACTIYAIEILKNITSSEKMAYRSMLILDAVTVFGMYLGCALSKVVTRRKQLLIWASIGVCFLYILSVYLYMVKLNVIKENNYVSLFLLIGFSLSISTGPIIIATTCAGELTPLRYRSSFVSCLSILANLTFGITIKYQLNIFKIMGTQGAFLCFGVTLNMFVCLLYKYLPETKDKTIQEVEELITGVVPNEENKIELLPLKKLSTKNEVEHFVTKNQTQS